LTQVVNAQGGPIFAKAVGQYTIGALLPPQIYGLFAGGFDAADALNLQSLSRVVLDRNLDVAERPIIVGADRIAQGGTVGKAARGHGDLVTRTERVFKGRLGNLMLGIVRRLEPTVINLRSHPGMKDRCRVRVSPDPVGPVAGRHSCEQVAIVKRGVSGRSERHPQNHREGQKYRAPQRENRAGRRAPNRVGRLNYSLISLISLMGRLLVHMILVQMILPACHPEAEIFEQKQAQ
jgi:hypothetical protein